jgi:hypothetical protein
MMKVKRAPQTIQVSFRFPRRVVERMREASSARSWPPPPSQKEIALRGVEMVLDQLEKRARGTQTG